MKLALVLALAGHFSRTRPGPLGLREAVVPLVLMAIPAAAILAQPDLGSAAIVGIVAFTMLLVGGVRLRWFAALGAPVIVLAPIMWRHLKAYQQRRILTFLNPDMDPLGAGYHVIQSKIAVGSGMLWGKGFLQGTQNHLNFLPEQHTDFVFAVLAEEWGFIGAIVLLTLYGLLLARLLVIAWKARDRFGSFLAVGAASIVFWQLLINLGMNVGILPVVGVPLPLLSYGGSSLLTVLITIG